MDDPQHERSTPDRGAPVGVLVVAGLVVASSLVLAVRVLRSGYGADNDTFLMLGTWDVLVDAGRYVPSRYQGYPLAELAVGAASAIGGHWASGLLAIALGAGCVLVLDRLVRRRTSDVTTRVLLLAVLVATPSFVIASSTSIDYVYGLFLFLLGWAMLERGSSLGFVTGVLSLALASGARVTYLPAGVILIAATRTASTTRRVVGAAVCAAVSVGWYVPAWRHHGDLEALVTADRPTAQGLSGLVARAGADGLDLLGLLGSALLCAALVIAVRQRRAGTSPVDPDSAVAWWALPAMGGYFAVLWFAVPIEPSYLLPLLVVVLVAVAPARGIRLLVAVAALAVMVHGWIVFEPYRVEYSNRYGVDSCEPTEAVGVAHALVVSSGDLLAYPRSVRDAAACNELLHRQFVDQWTD